MSNSVLDSELSEVLENLEIQSENGSSRNEDLQGSEISHDSEEDESFDECRGSTKFQVYNSSNVQIGPTINFNGPFVVSNSDGHNLPLKTSDTEVHLHRNTKALIGSNINYNGPVTIKQFVNVNVEDCEPEELPVLEEANMDNITRVRLIGRKMWLAQPPLEPLEPLKQPVNYIVILHTATEECPMQSDCVFMTRQIQNFHIEGHGWSDIGYSFLIGGDGNVYEGRGWDSRGRFAKGFNHLAIGIAVIGTFTVVLPSDRQIFALKYWIEEGVRLKKISPDYKILTHSQLSATTSPGTAFVRLIQTWPRWSSTPRR